MGGLFFLQRPDEFIVYFLLKKEICTFLYRSPNAGFIGGVLLG